MTMNLYYINYVYMFIFIKFLFSKIIHFVSINDNDNSDAGEHSNNIILVYLILSLNQKNI